MKLTLYIIGLLLLMQVHVCGTAQYPDVLVEKGAKLDMFCNPLETFFTANPKLRPEGGIRSSALWRGYVAHFEVRNDELWVKDVLIMVRDEKSKDFDTKWNSVLEKVFPKENNRKAAWYTGFLILPSGEMLDYVHMGYASTFEEYKLILVKDGRVLANRKFTAEEYKEYKKLQYEAFMKSERFLKMKSELKLKHGEDMNITAENFLYIFDVGFPCEELIDYKHFRPKSTLAPQK